MSLSSSHPNCWVFANKGWGVKQTFSNYYPVPHSLQRFPELVSLPLKKVLQSGFYVLAPRTNTAGWAALL